jgi:hypothetical protein
MASAVRNSSPREGGSGAQESERVTQLLAEIANLKKDADALRNEKDRLTKLLSVGGGNNSSSSSPGSRFGQSSSLASNTASQQRVLVLLDNVSSLESQLRDRDASFKVQGEELAQAQSEITAMKSKYEREKRGLEGDLNAARSRLAVLERNAANQQAWSSYFDSVERGMKALLNTTMSEYDRLKSDETIERVRVASRHLDEAAHKLQQADGAQMEAERLVASAVARERDAMMSEAVLAAREQKFASNQKKAEMMSLPERARRLQMLQSLERETMAQMESVRRSQVDLLQREHQMTAENLLLRRQVELLTVTVNHLRQSGVVENESNRNKSFAAIDTLVRHASNADVADHIDTSTNRTFYW